MNIVTIVPATREGDGPKLTNGTQVFLADGTKLEGVTRIELIAETNDIWRARIDVFIAPPKLEGVLAAIKATTYHTNEIGETSVVDVTSLSDDSMTYAEGSKQ